MPISRETIRQMWTAMRAMAIVTVLLGVAYPFVVTITCQVAFPVLAHGSLLTVDGTTVGSSLMGQSFADSNGNALPEWFQSRPSAAGYNGQASRGSNYGPENANLVSDIESRLAAIAALEGVDVGSIPADAVTASASGLDPHISPEYAYLQVSRVAEARGMSTREVQALVESMIEGRDAGFLGEPRVNVVELNVALEALDAED
jgi:K+-transporting ATPase ATPase C chain